MDSPKITSVSSTAAHPHVPRPKGPISSPVSISADTISSAKQDEEGIELSVKRLQKAINEEMISCLATLLTLEAADDHMPTRLHKNEAYSPEETRHRVEAILEVIDRLDTWSGALRKRAEKILARRKTSPVAPEITAAPPPKEKLSHRMTRFFKYLSTVFKT